MKIAFKVLIAVLVCVAAYLSYQVFAMYMARQNLFVMDPAYVYSAPPNADNALNVVAFVDYGCNFCREAHPVITQAVEEDGAIRYIPRPLFSMNAKSSAAAFMVYAAGRQGQFRQAHDYIIANYETLTPQNLEPFAGALNLDLEQLETDVASDEVQDLIAANTKMFRNLGGSSVPAYYMGDNLQLTSGEQTPEVQDFRNMFEEARQAR